MYHTKGFWGLESNPNAATINSTFNTFTTLTPILIAVVIMVAAIFVMSVSRGFG